MCGESLQADRRNRLRGRFRCDSTVGTHHECHITTSGSTAASLQRKLGSSIVRVCLPTIVGFKRLLSSPFASYHPERDLVGVVQVAILFVWVYLWRMTSSKTEGVWEVETTTRCWVLLGDGDERHRNMVIDYFGMDDRYFEEVDEECL